MEAKTTRFLTQFSRAVFQQWTQTPEREQFWKDDAFIHSMLEEAVAKLPRGKLKVQLVRDLVSLEAQLATQLRELHVEYTQKQQLMAEETSSMHSALLNEELTELTLTQAAASPSDDKQHRLAGVLALDTGFDVAQQPVDALEKDAEKLMQLFALIPARGYETPLEQQHKRGLVLRSLVDYVQKQVEELPKNWSCGEGDDANKVVQLRALLERVVVQDAVALAQEGSEDEGNLKAPWTMFYRPEETKELKQVAYDNEMAKIYGALLALALYFPIDVNEVEDYEETSGDSSSDDDGEKKITQKPQKMLGFLDQARLTTRKTLFAAQMRHSRHHQHGQWLVSVLTYLHSFSKPATYIDEDEDEALDSGDHHAILGCLGHIYSRAFASTALFNQDKEAAGEDKAAVADRELFEAVVCLRRAARFMLVEQKSSLPAVTTAMAFLAGVPLPTSFVSWLDYEQTAKPKSVLEKATQRLWKKCIGQDRMVNVLLSSSDVTTEELPPIQKSYLEYLERVADGNTDKTSRQTDANVSSSAEATEVSVVDAANLFYVDNAGGENQETMSKSKKKRANRKKKRANKGGAISPSKRSRASRVLDHQSNITDSMI
ncbi:hypothetical protein PHMEG_0004616 [Phytophthora megakarya]|uniref:Uncharacterized protein n=1 Tax=Phytophthora megakarya TaxID=4795 RepID=A0A225WTC9_9STRA|nr:hypothetical protein PHMEG_0004616 [Phytophthora megakarya]